MANSVKMQERARCVDKGIAKLAGYELKSCGENRSYLKILRIPLVIIQAKKAISRLLPLIVLIKPADKVEEKIIPKDVFTFA